MLVPFSVQHPSSRTTLGCGSNIFITCSSCTRSDRSLSEAFSFSVFTATTVVPSRPEMIVTSCFKQDNSWFLPSLLVSVLSSMPHHMAICPQNFYDIYVFTWMHWLYIWPCTCNTKLCTAPKMKCTFFACRKLLIKTARQWRTDGGLGSSNPPPRNSEGPPKSCQTQPNCENC